MARNIIFGYGNVGRLIAAELEARGEEVVLAHHRQIQVPGTAAVVVDSLDAEQVRQAAVGADRLYMTIGLAYKLSVWKRDWPIIVDNLIAAAKDSGAKIVFFDNIYLYGPSPLQNPITESHPRQSPSKKGAIRLALVGKLEAAMQEGVQVLITRAADFYGPNVSTSAVTMAVVDMAKGKKAYYLGDPTKFHSFTYVPDAAKAVVELALAEDTYNQSWHLPTTAPMKGLDFLNLITAKLGKGKWSSMGRNGVKVMGIFVPILRELYEMMYQFENDYVLDDSKFMNRFPDFVRTSYEQGIDITIQSIK
jgi:nucleoside-diphosphate-sugar epimerase